MEFAIRAAASHDLEGLHRLAGSLSARGFLTLPTETKELRHLIQRSERSFDLSSPDEGEFLFVLEDRTSKRVVGSSLIVARHGTPESPHLYFEVLEVQKASPTLKKVFKHQVLRLRLDAVGRSELGGLIVDPSYRNHPLKLGKHLSFVRFLYIDRHPDLFQERLLVELLPPLTPDGKSLFWESLGRKFTGLDYQEADRLSRRDKEFVTSLFPEGDFYTEFLPDEARALIGQVGSETKVVSKMLEELGFSYLNQIDPFDGGPHYGIERNKVKIEIVKAFLEKSPIDMRI